MFCIRKEKKKKKPDKLAFFKPGQAFLYQELNAQQKLAFGLGRGGKASFGKFLNFFYISASFCLLNNKNETKTVQFSNFDNVGQYFLNIT